MLKVPFVMSQDYGGPKVNKIVQHVQPGTGFWPIILITRWHEKFVAENYHLDTQGLKYDKSILLLEN